MLVSYANGKYVPTDKLALPFAGDITGTVRGYRIFTACRTLGDKIFRFDDHLNRVFNSARAIYMQLPVTKSELKKIIEETLERNRRATPKGGQAKVKGDVLIEIVLSGGPASANTVSPAGPAALYVVIFALKTPAPEQFSRGMTVAVYPYQRQWPEVKLLNYVGGVIAHQTVVKKMRADEVLFITPDKKQTVLEGVTFNFFVVRNNEVLTAPLDGKILPGITRKTVIELSRKASIKIREVRFTYQDLKKIDEAFLTSSTRNVMPVVKIDGFKVGTGRPGPVTKQLMQLFANYQAKY
ncbi:MAG: hypothetical protein A2445_04860 [Candidatus Jacksonbacteria bacterium RIFOXYC2_FULL_44_29]|nr:MAG: Branched-chain amino acid aminotransferase/4-amino-4-deoxychorismate lyase [Parcubacteria group bacterium GW2011_GWC2_44_22]OGY75191.1 MAG: hypothetical protein A2240_01145 [Candidatus Jacksonbacteria bacterium RIFOXYA2_FULL_43_12]OGY75653.1 MAG: hypothetical protein A2295_04740 [Candidatus Jacksonbacteria bacterium RIFOXYB2_FULL_44_15]OGY77797.1 MAG: hypothetical protein A2445_04860 [Candidatus Jacksonbacteria bacterium RIFOXYC2_FULL_44_29]OGY79527.1 MAG: hypothetical protein A2550_021